MSSHKWCIQTRMGRMVWSFISSGSIRPWESNQLRLGRLDGFLVVILLGDTLLLVQTHSVEGGRMGCTPYSL